MSLQFATKNVEAQPILGIRTSLKMEEIGQVLGSLFGKVYGYIKEKGQEPAGMPHSIYYSIDGDTIDLQCGMPVQSPIGGGERIQAGELPAGTVATATHAGPYEGLPKTWQALVEWIGSQGFQPAGAPWEVYVTDPGAEPDQSKWRTDIYFPVR